MYLLHEELLAADRMATIERALIVAQRVAEARKPAPPSRPLEMHTRIDRIADRLRLIISHGSAA